MSNKIDLNNASTVASPYNETLLSILIIKLALLRLLTNRGWLPPLKAKSNLLIKQSKNTNSNQNKFNS